MSIERDPTDRGPSLRNRAALQAVRPSVTILNVRPSPAAATVIDAVVLQPTRITVIQFEHTKQRGSLVPAATSAWTVGGGTAELTHGSLPHLVARQAAQTLAATLTSWGISFPFLEWVVAVDGDVTLEGPRLVEDGTVCLVRQLPSALAAGSTDTTTMPAELARVICAALGAPEPLRRDLPGDGFESAVAGTRPSDWRPRDDQRYLLEAGEVAIWEGRPRGTCRCGAPIGRGIAGLRRGDLRSFRYGRRCHFVLTNQRALVLDRRDDILRQCRLVPGLVAVQPGRRRARGSVVFGTRRLHPNDLAGHGRHLAFYGVEVADVLSCLKTLWPRRAHDGGFSWPP